ncbi:protein CHUP1, chloroplastic-like [Glycine soja]|uniref:Protein CHUP1, chloroplastic n=1 Tax=Glycine soja TaxID=3848 RepID=A0A445HFZ9_GLYSO|nr:protein CHUP1, chloroplastic-like [Glycine soja]KHN48214.1 Protein CHUP1, chloroplastic [Glycine soja]RZB72613.1 Protein CHUP1, chloroplastic [Glycine soja]
MGLTALKAENLKPVILKAGVPLAASFAGLIYAWIVARKNLSTKVFSSPENECGSPKITCHQGTKHEESFHHNLSSFEDEESSPSPMNSSVLSGSLVIHEYNNPCLEQEITSLRSQIEGLQMRELALRLQFELYCEMKEQESLLLEVKNLLSLENDRAEFLSKEISSIETETMRLESFVVQYMSVIEQLQYWKSQNRVLQRRVQRLLRDSKAKSRLIKGQALKIKEKEAEILRNHDALQTRVSVINKLKGEIIELQRILDQLEDEKNEVAKKLETAEGYVSKSDKEKIHRKPLKYYLEVESRDVSKEDYNKVLNELEEVKKERVTEVEELIHLRRVNACLREELMRHYEEQHEQDRDHVEVYESEHELHHSLLEHRNGSAHGDHASSKRRKLLKRLKRWVEGSEKVRVKPEIKCLDMHSGFYGSKKPQVPPSARFCSSA